MNDSVTVLLSGGMDSTTLAAHLLREGPVHGVAFNYGQRHFRELEAAADVADTLGIPFKVLDLYGVTGHMNPDSSTLLAANAADGVPEGHYSAENMAATVVPGRNLLFLAAATAYAASHGHKAVAIGAHAGDHPIYPDCRPDFLDAAGRALTLGYGIELWRPFADSTKAEIAAHADQILAPLSLSWSCYNGRNLHCGRCGTCVERREAFHMAGVVDPTPGYEDPDYWREATSAGVGA